MTIPGVHAAKSVFVPLTSIQNAPAAASPLALDTHVHWAGILAVALGVQAGKAKVPAVPASPPAVQVMPLT